MNEYNIGDRIFRLGSLEDGATIIDIVDDEYIIEFDNQNIIAYKVGEMGVFTKYDF